MSFFSAFWKVADSLSTFSAAEKASIENALVYREVPARHRLIDLGEVADEAYFILDGFLRFYYLTHQAEEITGFIFSPGQFASSHESFFSQVPSEQVVESVVPAKLLVIKHSDMARWIEEMRPMERLIRKLLEQRLTYAQGVVASLITLKPEERYLNMVESRPDLIRHIPQHILSGFIGITPVSMSRIRKRIR